MGKQCRLRSERGLVLELEVTIVVLFLTLVLAFEFKLEFLFKKLPIFPLSVTFIIRLYF